MNFSIIEVDDFRMLVIDNTRSIFPLEGKTIHSIKMNIESPSIPNGHIYDIDVLAYIRKERKEREMYVITSETLGFENGIKIPDGVYKIELIYNNNERVTKTVLFIRDIQKKLKEISEDISRNTVVTNSGVYLNDPNKVEDAVNINIAFSVYYELITNLYEWNVIKTNDLIDKLKRILLIIR